jgi:hypothetical protein
MDDPYMAWRVEYDRVTAAKHLKEDRKTAAKRLEEDQQVKHRREEIMRAFEEPYMTLTAALNLLGLIGETHLIMEDIYAEWTWRMAGNAASSDYHYAEMERFTCARDMLLDYTIKHLAVDVSVPPMDNKQAADLLEIPENAEAHAIRGAYERMVCFVRPPKNGIERYMREKKLHEAQRVMLANL